MDRTADIETLNVAARNAGAFLAGLPDRRVVSGVSRDDVRTLVDVPLPEQPSAAAAAIDELAAVLEPGLVASAGPRFFGFVVGGSLPIATAAEWMATTWDQNVGLEVLSPAMAAVEETAGRWLSELLGLPSTASFGFVTGATMANWTGLAAARYQVLADAGWDVNAQGMAGSPPITVIVGAERHASLELALRYLGIGSDAVTVVAVDDQGRLDVAALAATVGDLGPGPVIVCAQAGNVNSGAVDDVGAICDVAREAGAWVHVDAAVCAWLAASPRYRDMFTGWDRADSWATDAHKGLNVTYDSGVVFCSHPAAHEAACTAIAPYLQTQPGGREASHWVPEMSRRARALGIYAALRQLGRRGVVEMVERQCDLAGLFERQLAALDGVEVINDVVTNQVLVRFMDSDSRTQAVVEQIQSGGVCWMGPTRWHDRAAMRISVSNWSTSPQDVDRSVAEIARALAATA